MSKTRQNIWAKFFITIISLKAINNLNKLGAIISLLFINEKIELKVVPVTYLSWVKLNWISTSKKPQNEVEIICKSKNNGWNPMIYLQE